MMQNAAPQPIRLEFQDFRFSLEQWRAIVDYCPEQIELSFEIPDSQHGSALSAQALEEMAKSNTGNLTQLNVLIGEVSREVAKSLSSALASYTSLNKLRLSWSTHCEHGFLLRILGNPGLVNFKAVLPELSQSDWSLLWSAVRSHPSLRTAHFDSGHHVPHFDFGHREPRGGPVVTPQADLVFDAVRSNHRLCDVEVTITNYGIRGSLLSPINQRQLDSLLSFNRFRHEVGRLQQESDPVQRERLFATLLLDESTRNDVGRLLLLLSSNPISCPVERTFPVKGPSKAVENDDDHK